MAPFRTLWSALVSLYEETLVLVGANLAALALNLPAGLLLFFIGLPLFVDATQLLIFAIALLMPFLPTPGNLALAGLTRIAAGPDVPRFYQFREALLQHWLLGLKASAVSVVIGGALIWNLLFYANMGGSWLQFVSILWLYAFVLWLGVHVYVLPLAVHLDDVRLFDLYRRAFFIGLGHPFYTLVLLVTLVVVSGASVFFLPVYVLVAPAFISLVQAHALREVRRRHGDLVVETEEELRRL